MANLFGRQAAVTIDTLRVTGLDMKFRIDKSLKPSPNKAKIEVFNLNPDHRAQFQRDGSIQARLEVGYDGSPLQQLFLGILRRGYSVYEPPDWRTIVTSGDGEDKHRKSRVSRSYAAGTTVEKVVTDAAEDLGVGIGNALDELAGAALRGGLSEFSAGKVIAGQASKVVRGLLRSVGKEYSIQDGALQVLPIGGALATTAVLLTPDTGLIGSPEPGTEGRIKARALLQPEIFPGRQIEIRSRQVSGFYRAEVCSYVGDTAGQDWYVDIEGKAL